MTTVQQTRLVLLRRNYSMLSWGNHNELTGFKLPQKPFEHKETTSFMDEPLVSGESVVVTLVDRDS